MDNKLSDFGQMNPCSSSSSANSKSIFFSINSKGASEGAMEDTKTTLPQTYICNCGQLFSAMDALEHHVLTYHPENPNLSCNLCPKQLSNVKKLQRHLSNHSESPVVRKFKCNECGKAFKFKHHLKEHERIHTGEKPFMCKNCGKRFSHSGSYSSHTTSKKCMQSGKKIHPSHGQQQVTSGKWKTRNESKTSFSESAHVATLDAAGSASMGGEIYHQEILQNPSFIFPSPVNPVKDEAQEKKTLRLANYLLRLQQMSNAVHSPSFQFYHSIIQSSLPSQLHHFLYTSYGSKIPEAFPLDKFEALNKLLFIRQQAQLHTILNKERNEFQGHREKESPKISKNDQESDFCRDSMMTYEFFRSEGGGSFLKAQRAYLKAFGEGLIRSQLQIAILNMIMTELRAKEEKVSQSTFLNWANDYNCNETFLKNETHNQHLEHCSFETNSSCVTPDLDIESINGQNTEDCRQNDSCEDNLHENEDFCFSQYEQNEQNFENSLHEEHHDDKKGRVRTLISEEQLNVLKRFYNLNPRPKREELEHIASKIGHPFKVVKVWFQNSRARDRREGKCTFQKKPGTFLWSNEIYLPGSKFLPVVMPNSLLKINENFFNRNCNQISSNISSGADFHQSQEVVPKIRVPKIDCKSSKSCTENEQPLDLSQRECPSPVSPMTEHYELSSRRNEDTTSTHANQPFAQTSCNVRQETLKGNISYLLSHKSTFLEDKIENAKISDNFSSQSCLRKQIQSDHRPFHCTICTKAFKHKHHLTEHMRLHTGERPFKCDRCLKSFTHSGSFSQHRNHRYPSCKPPDSSEKPYYSPTFVKIKEKSNFIN